VWPKLRGGQLRRRLTAPDGEAQTHQRGTRDRTRQDQALLVSLSSAEADGNRTRQTGRAGLYGFEAP